MKLGFFQFDVAPGEPGKNLQSIDEGTQGLDVDLLVLPELCTSGYLMTRTEASRLAIELPGDGLEPFVRIARRLHAWVVAGVVERRADDLYNSTVLVGPDGWCGCQRKVHLTTLERRVFARGEAFEPFDVGGARVGVVTCFDAWFPEASRNLVRRGAQILCQPAAFGGRRTLDVMRVRSMENRVFSVTANRLGEEQQDGVRARFRGGSQILNCNGEVIVSASDAPAARVADIDVAHSNDKANVMCPDLSAEWERYYERDQPLAASPNPASEDGRP